ELAVAAGLMVRPLAVPAAGMAAALLAVFAAALAVNVLRGRTWIDCGCFRNGLKQTVSWLLVARNIGLAAAALAVAWMLPASHQPAMAEGLVGLMAGATAMLLYLSASMLGGISAAHPAKTLQKAR
ncbi:MAG TPA: MauE/DoxX family redox-associated membrane protein, partial [Paracoccus sp. (in: a-proteobacteria)]|nr:MauE/DoxX family redox-associated membrane protein [Paracoccus sp. (in: a-proteobacteria)]